MNDAQRPAFRVAMTADFYDEAGRPKFADLGLSVLEPHPHVAVANFASHQAVIQPEQINGSNGVVVLTPQVTGKSITGCADLLAIGRFGVGYDTVDVAACTAAGVLVVSCEPAGGMIALATWVASCATGRSASSGWVGLAGSWSRCCKGSV